MRYFLIILLLSLPANAQIAVGGASQTQGQNSSQGQNLSTITQYNTVKQHPVAGARAYTAAPTSDCMGSSGVGGQGQFFGFSFSSTTQSKPCNIREDTKIAMWVLHDDELARRIFMQGEYAKATIRKSRTVQSCDYPTDECKQSKRFK
jgi:hypothetical protein